MDSIRYKNATEAVNARLVVRQAVNELLNNPKSTINALVTQSLDECNINDVTSRFVLYHLTDIFNQLKFEIESCSHATPSSSSLFSFLKTRSNETTHEIVSRFADRYEKTKKKRNVKYKKASGPAALRVAPVPSQVPPFKLSDLRSSSSCDSSEAELKKTEQCTSVSSSKSSSRFGCVSSRTSDEKFLEARINTSISHDQRKLIPANERRSKRKVLGLSAMDVPPGTSLKTEKSRTATRNLLNDVEKGSGAEGLNGVSSKRVPDHLGVKIPKMPTIKVLAMQFDGNESKRGTSPVSNFQSIESELREENVVRVPPQISARWLSNDQNKIVNGEIVRFSILDKSRLTLSEEDSSNTFAHISPLPRYS